MVRTRVLVVDDAVVVRRIVTDVLAGEPDLEVVGTAPNGRVALHKIPQVNPDVVTLDVEMPEMDGLETLAELRASYPSLPVIMFSTLTERGAAVTMDALLRGANDYVTKPANVGSVPQAMARIREELVPKIHALVPSTVSGPERTRHRTSAVGAQHGAVPHGASVGPPAAVEAIVVGVSTGGPNALAELLPRLPADLGVPVLVVQHMPPMFTRLLAERLDPHSALSVREAADGELVCAGDVLVAPGDHHLEVHRRGQGVVTRLTQSPPENSCRPAVDVLFRTAAAAFGAGTLGIVLTGMGYDGRQGAEHVVDAGGRVVAQDQATSVVWGMPGAVVAAGSAEAVVPLPAMSAEIVRRVRARRGTAVGA